MVDPGIISRMVGYAIQVATTQIIAHIIIIVSKTPSFNALRNDLVKQIALRINKRMDGKEEDEVKIWLNERLGSTTIKRLPNSIPALTNLQILDLNRSHIIELPSNISKLTSLKLLDINDCEHLQSIPYGISQLSSLEYLSVNGCLNGFGVETGRNKCRGWLLSINDLGTLKQLKRLELENNGETIRQGMLESMKEIESLTLKLT
ncbi:hypothetical protein KI387_043945 [Taxus chinensis]|uniref:Disease resistance R13L4/SHOC-2-like LRR domain-containing protein n=1 Tax=Taxus chinensis TaxID=29808 RepID=A0AA38GBQ3_TAXCH|nr:hypothetical protein KI387_043945 [Taxus chinensis]